ncbi:rho guanine nucleotide exchange factor 1b [Osmerus eperlanus]|uniref:rho guanine nucleotide exchange factor 1b n=1 Tax=Osmerus eperlanus TaxID=29151 RepID=UPI002E15A240
MSIIGAEDEDFENDLVTTVDDQCSHFNSIELVKTRPTHLLVFLQHVILQFDCAPLLCFLHAELFKNTNTKETRKQFVEFYNTFLDKGAILRVCVPQSVSSELDRTRPDLLPEDQQRRFAQEIQSVQVTEVLRQLEDFRQKRMMGMTPNEQELVEVESHYPTDRVPMEMKEKAVAENLLDRMSELQPTIVSDEEKCHAVDLLCRFSSSLASYKTSRFVDEWKFYHSLAIFGAVAFYMKHLGVKTRAADSKKSRGFFRRPLVGKTQDKVGHCSMRQPGTDVRKVLRSESARVDRHSSRRRVSSRAKQPRSRSDVDLQAAATAMHPAPPSPKHHFFFDVPSPDSALPGPSPLSPAPQQEEVEPRLLELEQDPTNWRELAPADTLARLSKKETKRQEVINELYVTEHAHVRMLSVLQMVFSRPLERESIMTSTDLATIFPNLDEIIEMHYAFYENLKKVRQEDNCIVSSIRTTLHNRFGGTEGEWFQKLTARFCSHQTWALEQIKMRQKKDPRFNAFILEAESKPQCRRLQLKDIIPIEMQRLTKYPLLLENIAKSTEDSKEKESIQQSAECCRKILNHVNDEVKQMENLLTLKDYQRRLDTSGLKPSNELYTEYRNIDLTQKKMIYEGPLIWRVTKEKALDVQCVLLGDLLVLLQRQDDKMVLKCQSKSNIAVQEGKQMLSPIIKLDSAFLREVATDRKAFYVIFTWDSGAQIYELVAQSLGERKNWTDVIKSAVDELKQSGPPVIDRKRQGSLAIGGVASPFSPTTLHAPLSPTENGGDSLKPITDRDKDSLTDEKTADSPPSLIDYLSDKGFDLIGHTNSVQEKVANGALDEVMSLKRLLVGSISLSEDSHLDEENGGEASERKDQESEGCQSTEKGSHTEGGGKGEEAGPGGEEAEMKGEPEEEGGISAPLVLSQERREEVRRRFHSLEEHLKKLQGIEEAHHQLLEALSKFTFKKGNFH